MIEIINQTSENLNDLIEATKDMLKFVKAYMEFNNYPSISLMHNQDNSKDMLANTAFYNPDQRHIGVYTNNRHPKDILRSICHELVHHKQNEMGNLEDFGYQGEGYFNKNKHLRGLEEEAFAEGNMAFRSYEEKKKEERRSNESKKKNQRLKSRILKEQVEYYKENTEFQVLSKLLNQYDETLDNEEENKIEILFKNKFKSIFVQKLENLGLKLQTSGDGEYFKFKKNDIFYIVRPLFLEVDINSTETKKKIFEDYINGFYFPINEFSETKSNYIVDYKKYIDKNAILDFKNFIENDSNNAEEYKKSLKTIISSYENLGFVLYDKGTHFPYHIEFYRENNVSSARNSIIKIDIDKSSLLMSVLIIEDNTTKETFETFTEMFNFFKDEVK
ncbi:hypothetical protein M0R19_03140 [Candidatus Pacearchaeota archaeon]|jgi:hypothetical protein|nr:hypothetical protein [Candidatus Pacearchaeota archaeon]